MSKGESRARTTPVDVVTAWFDSFARGDLEAARELFAIDGIVHVLGEETVQLHGFDAFVDWYRRRRESLGASFDYRVDELLGGDHYAAALVTLVRTSEGRRFEWRQVAVYRVVEGTISEVRAYEEPSGERGSWSRRDAS